MIIDPGHQLPASERDKAIELAVHLAARPTVKRPRTAAARAALGQRAAAERGELQQWVADLATWLGLLHYHTHDSRHSPKGWPDSVFLGNGMLFRELKTEWATLDPDQKAYGAALLANGQDWDVWRPHDWFPSHECPQGLIREQLTAICHGLPAAPRLVAK